MNGFQEFFSVELCTIFKFNHLIFFCFISHATSLVRNNRFRRDARALEEEEEIWFNQDDDESETGMQVSDLKIKLDSDLDHIHKLWETKKGGLRLHKI